MSELPANIRELPLHVRGLLALQGAVAEVIEESVLRKLPIYVWRDGQVVDILPEKLRERSARAAAETHSQR
jgi:hypothetical protein